MDRLQEKSSQKNPLPLLVLVMMIPLLMGALCTNSNPAPITTNKAVSNIVSAKVKDTTITTFSQLKMLDGRNGWATTPQLILKTTDGGSNWTDLTPADWKPQPDHTPQDIQGITSANFLDANHAWIVGQTKTTQASIDAASTAGANTQKSYTDTGTVTVDNSTPIDTTIYVRSTIDGGRTWMTSNAIAVQNVSSVSQPEFVNTAEGWLEVSLATTLGKNYTGDIYHTLDGGITWTQEKTQQIPAPGPLSGLTIVPDCAIAGSVNTQLLPCSAQPTSTVQGCTVTGTTQYLGLTTATQSNASLLWLSQKLGTVATWRNINALPIPGGAPAQSGASAIITSPPFMFQDGTGILPIQMQSDPQGPDQNHLFLHLDEIKQTLSGQSVQVTDLSPTTTFAVPQISSQNVLSATATNHAYVIGQDHTNGTYGNWNLYEFDGQNWITITSQTDGTIPAPAAGQQAEPFSPGLSNLDFISPTEGWATNGPNVYHITMANNVATWASISAQVAPLSNPGQVVPAPTNPPPCVPPSILASKQVLPPVTAASKLLHTFTFVNNTNQTIWVGADGTAMPDHGTWDGQLAPGASNTATVSTPTGELWSGRFWGRTGCVNAKCETGDCGTAVFCTTGGLLPATLAEFALNGAAGLAYYDVSLVDGYNLPMLIKSSDGEVSPDNCGGNACIDLNAVCPTALQDLNGSGQVVGCKSACTAFGTDQYCCVGAYNSTNVCNPNNWPADNNSAKIFKAAYPHAYSYAYDDATSTFTCGTCNFTVTFGTTATALASNNAVASTVRHSIPTNMVIPPGKSKKRIMLDALYAQDKRRH